MLTPLALRALTWPVVSLNWPSLARMRQDKATFFANMRVGPRPFWIFDFRFWIAVPPHQTHRLSNTRTIDIQRTDQLTDRIGYYTEIAMAAKHLAETQTP